MVGKQVIWGAAWGELPRPRQASTLLELRAGSVRERPEPVEPPWRGVLQRDGEPFQAAALRREEGGGHLVGRVRLLPRVVQKERLRRVVPLDDGHRAPRVQEGGVGAVLPDGRHARVEQVHQLRRVDAGGVARLARSVARSGEQLVRHVVGARQRVAAHLRVVVLLARHVAEARLEAALRRHLPRAVTRLG